MMKTNFHHIALSVRDLQCSQTFYEALGFREVHRFVADDKSIALVNLKLGESILELMCYVKNAKVNVAEQDKYAIGVKHFALVVPDIAEAFLDAQMAGYKIRDPAIIHGRTGIKYFFLIDPDDMWVEIVQDDRGY